MYKSYFKGAHSLSWVRKLPLESWCAITADAQMKSTVEKEVSSPGSEEAQGRIILGNWDDETLLEGETFEVNIIWMGMFEYPFFVDSCQDFFSSTPFILIPFCVSTKMYVSYFHYTFISMVSIDIFVHL